MVDGAKDGIEAMKYKEGWKLSNRRSRCSVEPRQRIANSASTELSPLEAAKFHADALPQGA
jgi:hypothetical protein